MYIYTHKHFHFRIRGSGDISLRTFQVRKKMFKNLYPPQINKMPYYVKIVSKRLWFCEKHFLVYTSKSDLMDIHK